MAEIFWENFKINLNKYPSIEKFHRNIFNLYLIKNIMKIYKKAIRGKKGQRDKKNLKKEEEEPANDIIDHIYS